MPIEAIRDRVAPVTLTPPLNDPLFRFVFACPSRRKCQDEWTAVSAATTCEQERRSCEPTPEIRRPPNWAISLPPLGATGVGTKVTIWPDDDHPA